MGEAATRSGWYPLRGHPKALDHAELPFLLSTQKCTLVRPVVKLVEGERKNTKRETPGAGWISISISGKEGKRPCRALPAGRNVVFCAAPPRTCFQLCSVRHGLDRPSPPP